MTKQDVITRMTNKGAVDIKEATAPFPKDYNGNEMHDIHYRRSLGGDSKTKPATLRLIKEGADDFVYENGMPGWMQDAPTTTPKRAQLMPHADIVTNINAKYQLISDDSYTISAREGEDIISARVLEGKDADAVVTTKQFSVYDDKGTPVLKEVK